MTSMSISIAPWLSVRNGKRAVAFYKAAFGASEIYHIENPAGEVVSRLSVEGAEFWLSDESPEHGNFSPESLGGGSGGRSLWPSLGDRSPSRILNNGILGCLGGASGMTRTIRRTNR